MAASITLQSGQHHKRTGCGLRNIYRILDDLKKTQLFVSYITVITSVQNLKHKTCLGYSFNVDVKQTEAPSLTFQCVCVCAPWQFELVQEASFKIRRHYRNMYRYGSGAKTICKLVTYFRICSIYWKKAFLIVSIWLHEIFFMTCNHPTMLLPVLSLIRSSSWGIRWLGLWSRHYIFVYLWAAGPWAVRLPPSSKLDQ